MVTSDGYWYDSNMATEEAAGVGGGSGGLIGVGAIVANGLYGEQHDLPDLLHCELISARSRRHGWELRAHRHPRLHQVLVLDRGGGTAELEGGRQALGERRAVNVPAGVVHSFTFHPGTDGWVITLATELVDDVLRHDGHLRAALARPSVLPADDQLLGLASELAAEHDGPPRPATSPLMLRSLAGMVLAVLARTGEQGDDRRRADIDTRLAHFLTLLEEHVSDRWPVARYAAELGVSPTHLSRISRAATGKPASRLIDDRVVLEARRSLAYTDLPVAAIGAGLGFTDPAYFSRVFRRVVGRSPRAFRAGLSRSASERS